jgi:hypothetical protein
VIAVADRLVQRRQLLGVGDDHLARGVDEPANHLGLHR